jgi:hypothetical protein
MAAGDLGQYIAATSGTGPRRHTLCDKPPLDPRPGAALITAAAGILADDDLRLLCELLAPSREAGGSAATGAPGTTAQADSGTPSNP